MDLLRESYLFNTYIVCITYDIHSTCTPAHQQNGGEQTHTKNKLIQGCEKPVTRLCTSNMVMTTARL